MEELENHCQPPGSGSRLAEWAPCTTSYVGPGWVFLSWELVASRLEQGLFSFPILVFHVSHAWIADSTYVRIFQLVAEWHVVSRHV